MTRALSPSKGVANRRICASTSSAFLERFDRLSALKEKHER
jgi:hypothetical protein